MWVWSSTRPPVFVDDHCTHFTFLAQPLGQFCAGSSRVYHTCISTGLHLVYTLLGSMGTCGIANVPCAHLQKWTLNPRSGFRWDVSHTMVFVAETKCPSSCGAPAHLGRGLPSQCLYIRHLSPSHLAVVLTSDTRDRSKACVFSRGVTWTRRCITHPRSRFPTQQYHYIFMYFCMFFLTKPRHQSNLCFYSSTSPISTNISSVGFTKSKKLLDTSSGIRCR